MPENQNIEWKSKWEDDYLEWVCVMPMRRVENLFGCDDEGNVVGVPNA